MPPKVDSKSLSASLEGLTNISSSIASDMQKMNEALESMKKQVDLVEKKQADHEVSIIEHGARKTTNMKCRRSLQLITL